MKKMILLSLPVLILGLAALTSPETPVSQTVFNLESSADTSDFDAAKALAQLEAEISGRENEPAEDVFENIDILKGMPAGRVLKIMQFGFSRSLGVTCTHCHNPDDWASEEKAAKQIARDMWNLVGRINGELLVEIESLGSEQPSVNCTTCHRGEVKPALRME